MKKEHKFFEKYLENDLDSLFEYLSNIQEKMLFENIFNIDEEKLKKFTKVNGPSTQLGNEYNIFKLDHPGIKTLHSGLKDAVKEASEYYEIDFDSQNYIVHGWFNLDYATTENQSVSPMTNDASFHDHMGGEGAPVFHGYYCVNAEPSITYYKIDNKEDIFRNNNKNNRLILSETGHPHGRDDWFNEKPRITIAYDIHPSNNYNFDDWTNWIKL
jgi:hypothetical protein